METTDKTKELHMYINKLHPKNCTLETEVNNSINFLDLPIIKTDNRQTFNK